MDGSRFDTLARTLTTSRRVTVRTLCGGLVAALLAGGSHSALAACKKVGRRCEKNKDCCDHAECKQEECKCRSGFDEFNRKCYNLDNDENHCGACNTSCASGETCCDGSCVDTDSDPASCGSCNAACGNDETCCGGACVDLDSDGGHCGACDAACPAGDSCCDGVCRTLDSDEAHCGACGNACAAGETCCGGACVDLDTSRTNCGACGVRCQLIPQPEVCRDGQCVFDPNPQCVDENATLCGDECVDLQSDRDHCGECDNECAPGTRCCDGACIDVNANDEQNCGSCGHACDETETCCDGVCTNLFADVDNCGACGFHCPASAERCAFDRTIPGAICCFEGEITRGGIESCEPNCCDTLPAPDCDHCPNGTRCCNDACVDTDVDRAHCGGCGNDCDNTSICTNGTCLPCPPGRVVCGNVCCIP